MIIASAVLVKKDNEEFIIMGKRHSDCFEVMQKAGVQKPFDAIQGFVKQDFMFVNREDAKKHALECKQINLDKLDHPNLASLFSEDLW